MKKITIVLLFVLLVSCAKKTEELVTPDPPQQTEESTDSQRLGLGENNTDLNFDKSGEPEIAVIVDQADPQEEEVTLIDSVESVPEPETIEIAEPAPADTIREPEPLIENIIITPPIPKPEVVFADSLYEDYMINRGDFLSKIAKQQYGDWLMWKKIYAWNREKIGSNPNLIYPYRFLDLLKPAAEVKKCPVQFYQYVVSSGETLWSIAGKVFGDELAWIILYMDNEEMLEANDGILDPGMEIKLRKKLDPCS
ncbi:MAG: LysM peptidoglycan-binding domain-containing protein [Candidatus Marinimicrobia bacterium]|nr:LysM peptidoglycan-binding domain-containing protein [Candidatus Neomarinimicrobiota bacterium]